MRHWLIALLPLAAATTAHAQRASYEELQTFSAVLNLVRLNYVDSVTYTPLVRAAIEGALGSLDPHSRYVRKEVEDVLRAARAGAYGSAGVELEDLFGTVTVLALGRDGPADRAGVMPGDRIVSVQDTATAGLRAHDVELLLTGPVNTTRRIVVERGNNHNSTRVVIQFKLANYVWPAVSAAMLLHTDVGYVRLDQFSEGAARELERSLTQLRRDGARRLVLDLRGNPGGLLTEAVSVTELFLPNGSVVFRTVGRKSDASAEYRTRRAGAFRELPLVVMVDGSSASAAEAVAGALHDHQRATIVGHRTFGKALVQMPFPLPAGDVLWLTVSRVVTPDGRMIQRSYTGLTPGQYRAEADALRSGDSTAVRSGGIEPHIRLAARPAAPGWWTDVQQRGLDLLATQRAVLSSTEPSQWREPLLDALRNVLAENGLGDVQIPPMLEPLVARHLIAVALAVRLSATVAEEYRVRTDSEIAQAAATFATR